MITVVREDGQFTPWTKDIKAILAFSITLGQESKAARVCWNKSTVNAVKETQRGLTFPYQRALRPPSPSQRRALECDRPGSLCFQSAVTGTGAVMEGTVLSSGLLWATRVASDSQTLSLSVRGNLRQKATVSVKMLQAIAGGPPSAQPVQLTASSSAISHFSCAISSFHRLLQSCTEEPRGGGGLIINFW